MGAEDARGCCGAGNASLSSTESAGQIFPRKNSKKNRMVLGARGIQLSRGRSGKGCGDEGNGRIAANSRAGRVISARETGSGHPFPQRLTSKGKTRLKRGKESSTTLRAWHGPGTKARAPGKTAGGAGDCGAGGLKGQWFPNAPAPKQTIFPLQNLPIPCEGITPENRSNGWVGAGGTRTAGGRDPPRAFAGRRGCITSYPRVGAEDGRGWGGRRGRGGGYKGRGGHRTWWRNDLRSQTLLVSSLHLYSKRALPRCSPTAKLRHTRAPSLTTCPANCAALGGVVGGLRARSPVIRLFGHGARPQHGTTLESQACRVRCRIFAWIPWRE